MIPMTDLTVLRNMNNHAVLPVNNSFTNLGNQKPTRETLEEITTLFEKSLVFKEKMKNLPPEKLWSDYKARNNCQVELARDPRGYHFFREEWCLNILRQIKELVLCNLPLEGLVKEKFSQGLQCNFSNTNSTVNIEAIRGYVQIANLVADVSKETSFSWIAERQLIAFTELNSLVFGSKELISCDLAIEYLRTLNKIISHFWNKQNAENLKYYPQERLKNIINEYLGYSLVGKCQENLQESIYSTIGQSKSLVFLASSLINNTEQEYNFFTINYLNSLKKELESASKKEQKIITDILQDTFFKFYTSSLNQGMQDFLKNQLTHATFQPFKDMQGLINNKLSTTTKKTTTRTTPTTEATTTTKAPIITRPTTTTTKKTTTRTTPTTEATTTTTKALTTTRPTTTTTKKTTTRTTPTTEATTTTTKAPTTTRPTTTTTKKTTTRTTPITEATTTTTKAPITTRPTTTTTKKTTTRTTPTTEATTTTTKAPTTTRSTTTTTKKTTTRTTPITEATTSIAETSISVDFSASTETPLFANRSKKAVKDKERDNEENTVKTSIFGLLGSFLGIGVGVAAFLFGKKWRKRDREENIELAEKNTGNMLSLINQGYVNDEDNSNAVKKAFKNKVTERIFT